jgi:hypothetical protein
VDKSGISTAPSKLPMTITGGGGGGGDKTMSADRGQLGTVVLFQGCWQGRCYNDNIPV